MSVDRLVFTGLTASTPKVRILATFAITYKLTLHAALGAMYGLLIIHAPPASVHRTAVNAFRGTENLKPLRLGRSWKGY